jgi:hypothetical protein
MLIRGFALSHNCHNQTRGIRMINNAYFAQLGQGVYMRVNGANYA